MFKFSAVNNMDSGVIFDNLSELIIMEEMMIAKFNMYMQIKRICDLQYKYSEHTVCFIQNVQFIAICLSRLPPHVSIVLVKSRVSIEDDVLRVRFGEEMRVRCDHIVI